MILLALDTKQIEPDAVRTVLLLLLVLLASITWCCIISSAVSPAAASSSYTYCVVLQYFFCCIFCCFIFLHILHGFKVFLLLLLLLLHLPAKFDIVLQYEQGGKWGRRRPRWLMVERAYLHNLWRASQAAHKWWATPDNPSAPLDCIPPMHKVSSHKSLHDLLFLHSGFPPFAFVCLGSACCTDGLRWHGASSNHL